MTPGVAPTVSEFDRGGRSVSRLCATALCFLRRCASASCFLRWRSFARSLSFTRMVAARRRLSTPSRRRRRASVRRSRASLTDLQASPKRRVTSVSMSPASGSCSQTSASGPPRPSNLTFRPAPSMRLSAATRRSPVTDGTSLALAK
jgi:hypothetical protein